MNDYRLVVGDSTDELQASVHELLDKGWEIEGPFQLTKADDGHIQYVQTVVKP